MNVKEHAGGVDWRKGCNYNLKVLKITFKKKKGCQDRFYLCFWKEVCRQEGLLTRTVGWRLMPMAVVATPLTAPALWARVGLCI